MARTQGDAAGGLSQQQAGSEFALGIAGGVPLPCAVLEVMLDEDEQHAVDARYVSVNDLYCGSISRDPEGLCGRSFSEVNEVDEAEWLSECYRVAVLGEYRSGFRYDGLVRDWICYALVPSGTEGQCVYAHIPMAVDDDQRRQLMATADARTSLFVSDMLSTLAAEQSYDEAMNGMLRMMSQVIHADRLSVFECSATVTKTTFELVSEGAEPQLGLGFSVPREIVSYWFRNMGADHVMLVPNVSVIKRVSEPLYMWCMKSGTHSLLAAPFFSDGEIVGFLGAYNYQIDETIDLNRLFKAVSTFIAARIENRQLIDDLKRTSTHDALTGLLNRRGCELAIDELLEADPEGRHALALIDLDDFKKINDVFGHGAGDEALRRMSATLRETFATDAILSRNGGDEFLVVLSGEASNQASALLATLTDRGLSFDYAGQHHKLTLSVGYARYPEQADSLRELISKADTALYAVKLAGKAGFGKYTYEAEDHMRRRLGFSTRDLLESVPWPLLVSKADEKGDILFASHDLAHLLGYRSTYELMRLTGGTFAGIVDESERARLQGLLGRHDAQGTVPEPTMVVGMTRDGVPRTLQATFRFVDIADSGKVLYTTFNA